MDPNIKDWVTIVATVLMVVLTAAIAALSYFVWKTYQRIEWLTGSMETHSTLMLRIEAMRGVNNTPIEVVWWDPTVAAPPVDMVHGQPAAVNRIHVYLPPELRRFKKNVSKATPDER